MVLAGAHVDKDGGNGEDGAVVDFRGNPADKSRTGGWLAAGLILGSELSERICVMGISMNLVTYLVGSLHISTSKSANIVTNFMGTLNLLALLAGFLADAKLGRYLTVAISAIVTALGVILLTLSTTIPSMRPPPCSDYRKQQHQCIEANGRQLAMLFTALYTTALGGGGIKANVSGFGSDQFDVTDSKEEKAMIFFFNRFYFCISLGSLFAVTVLVYIQDNVGRGWGYGISAGTMAVAVVILLSGTPSYRFRKPRGSPLTVIWRVLFLAWKKRSFPYPPHPSHLNEYHNATVSHTQRFSYWTEIPKTFLRFHQTNLRLKRVTEGERPGDRHSDSSSHDLRRPTLIMSSSASVVSNGDAAAGKLSPASIPGRSASVYSEVQTSRLNHPLPLPSVLNNPFKIVEGPRSSAAGNPDEIAKLFPSLFGQPSAMLVPSDSAALGSDQKLKIGVVLSGGQAPGGHNVISGIFDYLQDRAKGSTLYGFKGGPAGIMKCKYVELTSDFIYPYRNQGGFDMICSGRDKIETPEQFKQAEETALKLDLDGLVVIGGDDSNTNACLLAENFRAKKLTARVIGCPKTIDGDLKCKEVPTSFGFDTACKIYAEMIGNVMTDARSTGKYYHFVRLMGRAASHITLECALQTHPNITIIGEEVAAKKQTLKNVTDYITDIVCKRAELGYNYGVILIPEGLIDFIPEVQQLIAELNEILAHDVVDEEGVWKKKLRQQSQLLFDFLPKAIQEQLMLERDPHGNVQVAKIETEKMLIQMVETELEHRKQEGVYKGQFKGQSHFFGYEGRCGLPTNFDSTYCYALGYGAGALLHSGKTGLISSVGNLSAPVEEWTVGGTALTALMDVERRHGKFKPVIKKAMVELEGAPFKKFESMRDDWALNNRYISPGPIQFVGPASNGINHTLLLELGARA